LLRSQVNQIIRNYFSEQDFIEVETPFFAKSTPEGARDFLVPSRLNEDKFYALPQSPQLFKQLLMVAGFDRYFQIVRCFRDEDLRLDRELEFTQLDMEMSFATPEDVMEMTETLLKKILKETKQLDLTEPFQRITYREAVDHYGSDKPDLRFDHPIVTVTEAFKDSQNGLFQKIVQDEGDIRAISVPYLLSKAQLKELDEVAHQFNFASLAFAKFDHGT
jgi:aspartyl-tRNA synthetase